MKPENQTSKKRIFRSGIAVIMLAVWVCILSSVVDGFAYNATFSWDASTDSTVVGYKLYYQQDSNALPFSGTGAAEGTSPVDVHNLTSGTLSGLDPNKVYYFAVTAYDADGNESLYSNIVPVAEGVSPTVSITSPTSNAALNGTVSVTASAGDNVGVAKVELYLNGMLQATETTTPYVFSLNTTSLASGSYTLMAKAYDAAGNVGQSNGVAVTVVNDAIAPVVALTAPASNAIVSGTVTITASASDNVGVSKVEFYQNGALLYATNVAPFSYNWDTTSVANGSYTVVAKAYDNAGNSSQSAVAVTVLNDFTPPVVSAFSIPAAVYTLSVPVITFAATDNVGITGYLITESASTPAAGSTGWTASVPESYTFATTGTKTLYAWVKDGAGNVSSAKSAITVISIAKTVSQDVMIVDTAITYPSIQDAYNTMTNSGTIAAKDVVFTSGLDFNRSVDVSLEGGLDSTFQSTSGTTAVSGAIKISNGKVVVKKIVVR